MAKRLRGSEALARFMDAEVSEESSGSDFDEHEVDNDGASGDSTHESSEDGDADDEIDEEWTEMAPGAADFQHFPFTVQSPGFQVAPPNRPTTPHGFFSLFFTDELFAELIVQTNDYARSKLAFRPLQQHSIWRDWKDVSIDEMKVYIGVILNMAVNDKPNLDDIDAFFQGDLRSYTFHADSLDA